MMARYLCWLQHWLAVMYFIRRRKIEGSQKTAFTHEAFYSHEVFYSHETKG